MERTEPSFIPGWLKGAGGGGGSTAHNNTDEGGFSRSKAPHQLPQAISNLDSPRKSTSSSKAFSSTSRRSHNSNGSVDRQSSDRDHFGLARSKSGVNRNSSIRNSSKLNLEQNGYNSWIDGEYGHDIERDVYSRKKDWLAGMVPDGKDKNKDTPDNPIRQLVSAGLTGKYSKLKRSQSMSLSAAGKDNDATLIVAPANGNITGSSHKSVFENSFPTLGTEDKQCSPEMSSIASPRPSLASPHLLWQGNQRSDLSRASSPGVAGGYGNPMFATVMSSGSDIWSSALADVSLSNGNVQCSNVPSNNISSPSTSQIPSLVGSVSSVTPLNMAEALTQNPPRVLTPPQILLENQRLEELALRQSRQLIPMTPSLPKAMSLVDKTKSKSSRTGDGSSTSLKLQSNSLQKAVTASKPDNLKSVQGKLLVLKPGKDGGSVMTTTPKSDVSLVPQTGSTGNVIATSATNIMIAQRKQHGERRATSVLDVMRTKDSAFPPDEKRPAVNAQNRSDFFNALRKKAAGIGSNVVSTIEPKDNPSAAREPPLASEASPADNEFEEKENGICYKLHPSSTVVECNGEVISSINGPINDNISKDTSGTLWEDESRHSPSPEDLDEEEAAFMRSLGWKENEECSELTQEEINGFYQTLEKKKFVKCKLTGNFRSRQLGGSVGGVSSGLMSPDLETDDMSSFLLQRAVSSSNTDVKR